MWHRPMQRTRTWTTLLLAFTAACWVEEGKAQQAPERYVCDFRQTSSQENLHIEYVYDRPRDKAFMIGNNGTSDVLAWPGSRLISFIELVGSGAVQTTSIDPKGNAIHSRHTYSGGFIQSQEPGQCVRQ